MDKLTKAQEERLRKEIATILVDYDKRYTVASLSILMDKIIPVIADELAKQREEIIEKLEALKSREKQFRRDINDAYAGEVMGDGLDKAIKEIKHTLTYEKRKEKAD